MVKSVIEFNPRLDSYIIELFEFAEEGGTAKSLGIIKTTREGFEEIKTHIEEILNHEASKPT